MKQKVGIIGSGQVARVLAVGFSAKGHTIMMGSRDVDKLNEWKRTARVDVNTGSIEDTAVFGDVIVLAVKGSAAEIVIERIADKIKDKIVLDTTNPIADLPPDNGVLKFFTGANESLMEKLQKIAPMASFVKVFNSVGSGLMVDPQLPDKPTMFICGNDEEAKKKVSTLLEQFGWEAADMGKVQAARALEPLCILWCIPGFLRNQWNHAFKLVRPR